MPRVARPVPIALVAVALVAVALVTVALVAVALVAPALGFAPAAAQDPGQQDETGQDPVVAVPETRLTISQMTRMTGAGSVAQNAEPPDEVLLRVLVEHRGPEELLDAEIVVESYARLTSRSVLRQALDEGVVGAPRRVFPREAVRADGPVFPGDVAARDIFLDVGQLTQGNATGVYPIQLTLFRGSEVLDSVVTAIVHLSVAPTNPLATVAVWPVDAAPAPAPGAARSDFEDAVLPGGRLDDLVAGLEQVPRSGIVPALGAHLLDALLLAASQAPPTGTAVGDRAAGEGDALALASRDLLERIGRVTRSLEHEPVTGAYAEADLAALVQAGGVLTTIGGEMAAEGRRRLEDRTGRAADPDAMVTTAPITGASLDQLPADHLLLPWPTMASARPEPQEAVDEPLLELRTLAGRIVTASIADPFLADVLAQLPRAHGTPVAVQRIVAETALVHLEQPGVADRPLLLLPPRDWDPGGRVARDLARALTQSPWLQLVGAGDHADLVPEDGQTPVPQTPPRDRRDLTDRVSEVLSSLVAIRTSLPGDPGRIQGRGLAELEEQVRRATSDWFADDREAATAMLDDVQAAIDAAYGEVEILTGTGVSLESGGGNSEIPVTIRRSSGDPLRVEVEVRSGGALAWPSGDTQPTTLEPGQRRTLTFDVEARARGDLRIDIIVRDAAGARVLAESSLRVRSFAISRPALIILIGLIVLLLVLGRRWRRPRDPEADDGLSVVTTQEAT